MRFKKSIGFFTSLKISAQFLCKIMHPHPRATCSRSARPAFQGAFLQKQKSKRRCSTAVCQSESRDRFVVPCFRNPPIINLIIAKPTYLRLYTAGILLTPWVTWVGPWVGSQVAWVGPWVGTWMEGVSPKLSDHRPIRISGDVRLCPMSPKAPERRMFPRCLVSA